MIRWSVQAERDLEKHYEFMVLTEIWNPDEVISQIFEAVEHLVLNPKMGRRIDDEIHKLTLQKPKYVIHYHVGEDILVTRVFHHLQSREL